MADAPDISPRQVEAAIEAARAVLRDLEPIETPAVLRKVRASSARRLPPPLARVLVAQLTSDPWLREKVRDAGGDWDPTSPDPGLRSSALLLMQPDGWEAQLADLAAERGEREAGVEVAALERRVVGLEAELGAAREKIKQLTKTVEAERAAAARRQAEIKASFGTSRRPDAEQAQLRARIEQMTAQRAGLVDDLRQADVRIERLKRDLLKARRAKPEGAGEDEVRSWGGRDPIDLARQLDTLTAAVMPEATLAEREAGSDQRPSFELPAGVAPDSPAAVDWLVGRVQPTTLIVDGYNVTWLLYPDTFASAGARIELLRRLARLKRAAVGPLRVVVVFDSQHGTIQSTHGSPVEVHFAASADDEVRRLAAETVGDVAVISTDREVREGSEGKRVLVLWSEALVGWRF